MNYLENRLVELEIVQSNYIAKPETELGTEPNELSFMIYMIENETKLHKSYSVSYC